MNALASRTKNNTVSSTHSMKITCSRAGCLKQWMDWNPYLTSFTTCRRRGCLNVTFQRARTACMFRRLFCKRNQTKSFLTKCLLSLLSQIAYYSTKLWEEFNNITTGSTVGLSKQTKVEPTFIIELIFMTSREVNSCLSRLVKTHTRLCSRVQPQSDPADICETQESRCHLSIFART